MTLQDSLAALLVEHDYNGGSGSVEYCLCGWEGQSGHAHHVAEVQAVWLRDHFTEIAGELGLTREARTLDDGYGGTATNWETGRRVRSRSATGHAPSCPDLSAIGRADV